MLKRYLSLHRCPWLVTERNGACLLLNAGEKTDRFVYLRDYEYGQIERMSAWIRAHRPSRFLDIGANFGLYSVVLGRRFPDLVVWGFEPVPQVGAQFQANVLINGLDNVTLHALAISDVEGDATFMRQRGGHVGLSRFEDERVRSSGQWQEITVRTRPLDALLQCEGERLAIKIDVEGHECRVLQGMGRLLERNHCYVQVEVFPRLTENLAFVIGRLGEIGYRQADQIDKDYIFEKT